MSWRVVFTVSRSFSSLSRFLSGCQSKHSCLYRLRLLSDCREDSLRKLGLSSESKAQVSIQFLSCFLCPQRPMHSVGQDQGVGVSQGLSAWLRRLRFRQSEALLGSARLRTRHFHILSVHGFAVRSRLHPDVALLPSAEIHLNHPSEVNLIAKPSRIILNFITTQHPCCNKVLCLLLLRKIIENPTYIFAIAPRIFEIRPTSILHFLGSKLSALNLLKSPIGILSGHCIP